MTANSLGVLQTTSPWTEDYLAPKIMAVGTPSGLYDNILTPAFCKHCSIVFSDSNVTYINLVQIRVRI